MQKIMNEQFKSRKSTGFGSILILVSALIVILFFGLPIISKKPIDQIALIIELFFTILVTGLFVWVWTTTFYAIDKESLRVKSGPFHWQILIQDIKIIRLNQSTVGGIIKPTLSWNCIEIEYGKHKTISISPTNQNRFIHILLDRNKEIEIKN
jgi:hypothetical protein